MALMINDDCIACGICADFCPNNAIEEDDIVYHINPDRCSECVGAHSKPQCASQCPVDACVQDPDHRETAEQLQTKYDRLHAA